MLLVAVTAIAALVAGDGPSRIPVALALASLVAVPFTVLAYLEGRVWRDGLHLRMGQLAALRLEGEWRALTPWEVADRIALLLRLDGVRVEWVPNWFEAEDAYFAVLGARSDQGKLVVRIERGPLEMDKFSEAVGRAVLEGARCLLIVALGEVGEPVQTWVERGAVQLRVELWRTPDLLERAQRHASA